MNRKDILDAAAKCVCGDREQDYGSPENNFCTIADLWTAYMKGKCCSANADLCICPEDVAAMLALLKIARISSGHAKEDNWIDLAGTLPAAGRSRAWLGASMKQAGKEVILTYADSNMNAYETARRLYRSSNSVLYQLQKVKEETGLDPRNFHELVKLVEMVKGDGAV